MKLVLPVDRGQISRVAKRRLIHVLELSSLGSYEKLLFCIVRDPSYSVRAIWLHGAHIPIFVFLGVLYSVPIFVLTVRCLSSRSDRQEKLASLAICALHHLVLSASIDKETLTIWLRAALGDFHVCNLFVFLHQISKFLAISRLAILRYTYTFAVSHIWWALLVALVLAESAKLVHIE